MDDAGAVFRDAASGALSPPMALMRLALLPGPEADLRARLGACLASSAEPARARLAALDALWRAQPGAVATVRRVAVRADHAGGTHADWAAVFDALAGTDPAAAVALYSFGDPGLLAEATAEVAGWLLATGLAGPAATVVDVGCGIGRIAAALAPAVGRIIATEVSGGMLAVARDALRLHPAVLPVRTGPVGLRAVAGGVAGLVLAVDVAPYWHAAGLLDAHVAEAGRVLAPGGALVLMNVSYGRDDAADGADLRRAAAGTGLSVTEGPLRPFALWDAAVWCLRRA